MTMQTKRESGFTNNLFVATVGLSILSALAIGIAIWAFVSYNAQKTDVEGRIDQAVATAKKDQADADETKFTARENDPTREFVGPDDYGGLTFNYSKNWSVHVAKDTSKGGTYEAYLNPVSVPPISASQQYALRVTIEDKDYDQVIASYDSLVKKGDLSSSSVTANEVNGTRLDGSFSKDIRGSAVIFKIRDKTLTVRTDADTFRTYFDALITTIKFNQ